MKPIPWPALSLAMLRVKGGDREAAALIHRVVDDHLAEAQAKRPEGRDWAEFRELFKARHPAPSLPRPVSSTPPPKPHTEPETEEAA